MRGMFTAGILDVWMENGILFDGAVGVSAGAVFGINLKSGQIGRVIRYNKAYCRDKRFAGMGSLLRTGDLGRYNFRGELEFAGRKENGIRCRIDLTELQTAGRSAS